MNIETIKIFNTLSSMIGNTPLLQINLKYKGELRTIYAKAEYYSFTGSIKDRLAFYILRKAYKNNLIHKESIIAEATSGNTGISFSAIGKLLGHKVIIFMPDWMSEERKNLIKSFGADIKLVSKQEGGFMGCIKLAEEFAKENKDVFLPRQFSNNDNCETHALITGPEIWWQLNRNGIIPDGIVAGVGTGGTIMGIGIFMKKINSDIKIYPIEPSNSPTLSIGDKKGSHRIQGISDEFIPAILKLNELDEIISVDDGDAIIMAQKLSSILGLGVGISSGANFLGAIKAQNKLGPQSVIVTVFPDDNKKYLSTALMNTEPVKDNFISSDVELLSFNSIKGVCCNCCML